MNVVWMVERRDGAFRTANSNVISAQILSSIFKHDLEALGKIRVDYALKSWLFEFQPCLRLGHSP